MVLDTMLHLLDMVVKNYTKDDPISPEEKTVEKKLLDSMPVGVCVTDILGKIHYANPMFLEITGHSSGEIGTLNVASLYSDSMVRKKNVKEMRATGSREIKTFKIPMENKGRKCLIESIERNIQWDILLSWHYICLAAG